LTEKEKGKRGAVRTKKKGGGAYKCANLWMLKKGAVRSNVQVLGKKTKNSNPFTKKTGAIPGKRITPGKTSYDVCFHLTKVLSIIPFSRNNLLKVHPLVTHSITHYMHCKPKMGEKCSKKTTCYDILHVFLTHPAPPGHPSRGGDF